MLHIHLMQAKHSIGEVEPKAKDMELRFVSNFGILQNGETTVSGTTPMSQGDFISPLN